MTKLLIYCAVLCCTVAIVPGWAEVEIDDKVITTLTNTPTDLNDVLAARRSTRNLSDTPIGDKNALQLLWAGQGINDASSGLRTAPSPYAKYLLTLLYCDASGVYKYDAVTNEMVLSTADDVRPDLSEAAYKQSHAKDNGALIVLTANVAEAKTLFEANAERFTYIEAGHVAQNILLEAAYLGLGACPLGGFDPAAATKVLQLDEGHEVVYMIPVGYKK